MIQQSYSKHVSQRTESRGLKRYLHIHIDSNTIHSIQEVEATQMFINRWIDKQMWNVHTMEYHSSLKR